jgi:two-component system, chemotaxis family, protein-glutamate methylesterase/glutaminase
MKDALKRLRETQPTTIAIGGSAGALDPLSQLLLALPPSLPASVLVVIHTLRERRNRLVTALTDMCALRVYEAEDKARPGPGCLYVAPSDYHMLLEVGESLALSTDRLVYYSRPSIDVLFESVAYACGAKALGILLSGASEDGARGLACMREKGALTWVQTPASAAVPLMPRTALALAPHAELETASMARLLSEWGAWW